jgi:PAS domain S-box-containing protein
MTGSVLSAPELRHLIEGYLARSNDGVIITDGELRVGTPGPMIRYVNAAALRLSGQSADDLIGKPLATLHSRETFPQILGQLRDCAENRQPCQHDSQVLGREGRPLWLEISTVPIIDAGDRMLHFVRISRDISARKRIEQERERMQRLLAAVFGVIEQALGVIDDSGNFLMINTALTRQLGWGVFDLIGKPFTAVIDEPSRVWLVRQFAVHDASESTSRLPTKLLHRDGTVIPGEIVSTIALQANGRQDRIVTFLPKPEAPPVAAAAAPAVSIQAAIRAALDLEGSPIHIVAGKVQLIGLADVRDALGERWGEVSTGVFTLAEHILRRRLGPNDSCHRTADDGFLVRFAVLGEAEAQAMAQSIAEEIRATLIGVAPELASARVEGFAAKISIESSETGSDEAIFQALERRLSRERKRMEGGAGDVLRRGLACAQARFQRVRTQTNQMAPFFMVRLPTALEAALERLQALDRPDYSLESELVLLTGAAERLLGELAENRSEMILVPVRMSTLLQRRDAERWLPIARSIGRSAKRRLIVEITQLGRDTARSRMIDLVMTISSLCRAVAIELPVPDTGFINGLPTSVQLATIPAPRLASEDGSGQVATAAKLTTALQNRNCRLLVKNIASPIQAMSLAKAGVPLLLTQQELAAPG